MKLDSFTRAYIKAALWSSVDDKGLPMDDSYDLDDISPETLGAMIEDCRVFQEANADDLQDPEQDGHDFWLTRNGHGVGFWDRGYGERGQRLTAACRPYGEVDLYIGDDGKVHGA